MSKPAMPIAIFSAEVKKVTSRKDAALNQIFQVVFETNDPALMNLGVIAPDLYLDVEVRLQDGQ